MLQTLGIKVTAQARARSRELNHILRLLRDRPDYPMLATVVLRTMAQAVYQPANIRHPAWPRRLCAFTSPIRRYPDLLVHRGIGHVIDHAGRPGFVSIRRAGNGSARQAVFRTGAAGGRGNAPRGGAVQVCLHERAHRRRCRWCRYRTHALRALRHATGAQCGWPCSRNEPA